MRSKRLSRLYSDIQIAKPKLKYRNISVYPNLENTRIPSQQRCTNTQSKYMRRWQRFSRDNTHHSHIVTGELRTLIGLRLRRMEPLSCPNCDQLKYVFIGKEALD